MRTAGIRAFFLLLLMSWTLSAWADELLLQEGMSSRSLVGIAEFFEDKENKTTFATLHTPALMEAFKPLEQKDINRGLTRSSFWLRFTIHNPTNNTLDWVVTPETSYLDNLDIYTSREGLGWRHRQVSDHQRFASRDLNYRLLNASFSLPANESMQVYVRLSTNTLETVNIRLFVAEKEALQAEIITEYLYFGLYYGLFLALAVLTVCLWSFAHTKNHRYHFYFLTYLLFNILMWTSLNGFSFQLFWPNHPWLFNQSFHIIYLMVAIFSFLFSRQLLGTKKLLPRVDKLLLALVALFSATIVLRLLGNYDVVLLIAFFSLLSMTIQPVLGWCCYQKGNNYVLFYIVAWIPYSIGLLIGLVSASSSWSYFGMSTLQLTQGAVLFECIMLILATLGKMKSRSEQLTELTKQDPLTRLGNRRHLEEHVGALKKEPVREGEHWLLLIDIDHFKKINDSHGHSTGDMVLVNLAEILKSECRSVDVAIRWGGEEFILLINVPDELTAYRIAERIRKTFDSLPSNIGKESVQHTLSIGLHKLDFEIHNTLADGVEQADKALYRAKSTGRNKVISYTEELEILQL